MSFNRCSKSIIFFILFKKNKSIFVYSWISSILTSLLNASPIKNNLSSPANLILLIIFSNENSSPLGKPKWCTPYSSDLIALSKDSSKVLPIAITSPVAFIWVPRYLSPSPNLSNGNLGIFVTT